MKLIPIIYREDKILGFIPRIDFAVFMFVELTVGFFRSFVSFGYGVEGFFLFLFICYLIMKRNLEKKEQSLFLVLWTNSRIPRAVAGVFRQKRFLGVHRDVDK